MRNKSLRNFWMTANVDGRESLVTAGPRSKDGGMSVNLAQLNCGESDMSLNVSCIESAGKVSTIVRSHGVLVAKYVTYRTEADKQYWLSKPDNIFVEGLVIGKSIERWIEKRMSMPGEELAEVAFDFDTGKHPVESEHAKVNGRSSY